MALPGGAQHLAQLFRYAPAIRAEFPELVSVAVEVGGITNSGEVDASVQHLLSVARTRLRDGTESALTEVQAWRVAFGRMGLKPTQYRCAAESLLRRFRKEGVLPAVHPLVDLCNAASLAFAIPIATFDLRHVQPPLEVRHADGSEKHLTFAGEVESPERGEVIFADATGNAHARRWCHRQSGLSAVRPETDSALIVAEALHQGAIHDLERLTVLLVASVREAWPHAIVAHTRL